MSAFVNAKRDLQRMAEARALTVRQLDAIAAQIRAKAEDQAIETIGGRTYCFGRHSTSWRPTHERAFLAHTAQLRDRRAAEISALQRKRDRQDAAIRVAAKKLGLNIDPADLVGRRLQLKED